MSGHEWRAVHAVYVEPINWTVVSLKRPPYLRVVIDQLSDEGWPGGQRRVVRARRQGT